MMDLLKLSWEKEITQNVAPTQQDICVFDAIERTIAILRKTLTFKLRGLI
jgi:hypothetical protein